MINIFNVLIFGTGNGSKKVIRALKKTVNIVAFVDNNEKKVGEKIKGKPIVSAQSIKNYEFDYIIIGSIYYKQITKQLIELKIDKKNILAYFKSCNYNDFIKEFAELISYKTKISSYFIKKYEKQWFKPSFFSIFINPFYLIRKGLYDNIKNLSSSMYGKMVDFGCGSKPYRELFDVDEYIGVDIEESGHSHVSENVDIYYDGKNIPLEDESVDCIFTSEVFEHIFNLDEILNELNRILKKNGKMLITVPFAWDEHEMPYDFARYTSVGLKYLLENHGFIILSQSKTTNFVETVFQMWNAYLFEVFPKSEFLKIILTVIFIFPSNLASIILSKLLPENYNYYNNNIILVEKVDTKNIN